MPPLRVVLAEDHALLRAGLTQLLEAKGFEVIAAVDNLPELERALTDPDADAAVVDVRMPPTFTDEGLRAAIAVRAARPGSRSWCCRSTSSSSTRASCSRAAKVRSGTCSRTGSPTSPSSSTPYAAWPRGPPCSTLRRGRRDGAPQGLAHRAAHRPGARSARAHGRGRANAGIAESLVVTEKAVAKHINSIFAKLDLPADTDDHRRVRAVLTWLRL